MAAVKDVRRAAHESHLKAMEYCVNADGFKSRNDSTLERYWRRRAWAAEKKALEWWLSLGKKFKGLERTMMLRSAAVVARDAGDVSQAYRFAALCLLSEPDAYEADIIRDIVTELEPTKCPTSKS